MSKKKSEIKKAARERNKAMLMGAVRADIAKPLGCSWEELGTILRGLRMMAHRVMNDTAFADEIARRDNCGVPPQTVAYRAATWSAASFTQWAREHKDERVRARAIEPSSNVVLGWASKAHDNVQRWHADEKAHRPARLPTMSSGAPIYVPRVAWDLTEADGALVLSVSLLAGTGGRRSMRIAAFRGSNWATLRGIADGSTEAGALQITYDERARRKDGTRGKWTVLISHKRQKPETKTGGGTLIAHRGQRNFMYLLPSTGMSGGKPIAGTRIAETKRRWEARIREIGSGSNPAERGTGAGGHGRKRRFASYDHARDRLDEILKTLCRQFAAEVVRLAEQWQCARVAIEDYGGIEPHDERQMRRFLPRFPLYMLKECIARACEKAGLELLEVPSDYISTTCPRCKVVDAASHNRRTGEFHCACGYDASADYVAAFHMLTSVYPNEDTPVHEAHRRAHEIERRMKKQREGELPTAAE